MKMPMPPIHETIAELPQLLKAEREAQKHQRLPALYRLPTQQARTRRQVARLLGVHRDTVGRWLAADAPGGIPQMLTLGQAPGTPPLLAEAIRPALRDRLAQPEGVASYQAIWQWLRQAYGLAIAYKTVPRLVRYTLRAKLQVPRKAHRKTP
jgi:transposase